MRSVGYKIAILLLSCTAFASTTQAQEQDSCYSFVDDVLSLYNRQDRESADVMTSIATVAQQGLECYEYEPRMRVVWLLNHRANALEFLGRYDDVESITRLFFDALYDAANGEYKGRWHMRSMHLNVRRRLYGSAAADYEQAQRFADSLDVEQRIVLYNNGALLYYRLEDYEEALREAEKGLGAFGSVLTRLGEYIAYAQLLHKRAEIRLCLFTTSSDSTFLDPARRDLAAAITLRDSLQITERQPEAHVTLGEIYHALGDGGAGRGSIGRGLALARDGGNVRGEIFALWRIGRMSRRSGLLSLGNQQLQEALRLSQESGIGEFELFIQLELGRLFEDGEAWKQAEGFYRAVVESPDEARYRSSLYDAAKARDEAERRSVAVRMHLAEADASRLRLALFGSVLLILLLGGAFAIQWRRTSHLKRRYAVLRNGKPEDDDLFERRRRYAYRVLERPAEVTVVLAETDLSVLLVAGLEHRTQLYACICALEERIDGHVIAVKNMRRFLHKHFERRPWQWPESVEGWRRHFEEHPLS